MKTAVIVPTLNADISWKEWIEAFLATDFPAHDVYIVDSGSTDATVELARNAGFNVNIITQSDFNHGGTRQQAMLRLEGYDLVIYLTQDAILHDVKAINRILLPFKSDLVGAVCGRQLPRKNAGSIEAHARWFNYPETASVNSIDDAGKKGLKAAFLSNSFAVYRITALKEVGGFPLDVVFGEDMYVATKLLQAGYQVAYAADASVYHSHGYSLMQEMRRYFDMGVFHANEPWIRKALGGAESEGLKFVVSEYRYLLKCAFWRIPEGIFRTILRYAGFRLGLIYKSLPIWLNRQMAMNKGYFN